MINLLETILKPQSCDAHTSRELLPMTTACDVTDCIASSKLYSNRCFPYIYITKKQGECRESTIKESALLFNPQDDLYVTRVKVNLSEGKRVKIHLATCKIQNSCLCKHVKFIKHKDDCLMCQSTFPEKTLISYV